MEDFKEHRPADCERVRETLSHVGDKWTAIVLGVLGDKCMRFKEIHRGVGTISQRMLAVTLRNLERDGLVVRTAYPVEHLRHVLAEMHVATLKHTVHICAQEMIGMLRGGKTMADYPFLKDAAKPMLDDLIWWANALKSAREANAPS